MIFLGIKCEPLSDPPPPVIKIGEWGHWDLIATIDIFKDIAISLKFDNTAYAVPAF